MEDAAAQLQDEDLPEELPRRGDTSPLHCAVEGHRDHQTEEEEEEPPEGGGETTTGWEWRPPPPAASHETKLRELLRGLCSPEVKIYSEASKELLALLSGDASGDVLLEYVRGSPRCSELAEAWRLRQGKPGMPHHLRLVAAVLGHPFGRSRSSGISQNIDSFARSIVTSKLDDLYVDLKSEEGKRQAAALFLLASIVRRGVSLALEMAKNFDFKLPALPKLSGAQKKNVVGRGAKVKHRAGHSTRRAFVEFAVSFLEVGDPRLLRWILQQKDMYSGVLRGLAGDDLETVVYVLSTLRDKVLIAESLVPPGLRSVLFGSLTLEQLSYISGNPEGGGAADVAHEVLLTVCTDPRNGLMPDAYLKGNVKRLSDFMKKLKATESRKHRELLLAIVKGRPFLCSSYMDEFPYHLEPRASPLWYSAISLAADLISAVNLFPSFSFLAAYKSGDPPGLDSMEVRCILKCILPCAFTRPGINKGLLHSDMLVKHGSLRLLLEALKLLDSLNNSINGVLDNKRGKQYAFRSRESDPSFLVDSLSFQGVDNCHVGKNINISSTVDTDLQKWVSLKEGIQDEVRSLLPDPQVLLKLLTSLNYKNSETSRFALKRCINSPQVARKKSKSDASNTDGEVDIIVGVIDCELASNVPEDCDKAGNVNGMDIEKHNQMVVSEIWGLRLDTITEEMKDVTTFFHAKLLDVLRFYLITQPLTLEGSFEFIKILPSNPSTLSINQQQAMLSLLVEYIGQAPGRKASNRVPDVMYKSLQPLISLMIFSPIQRIKSQVFILARAAMLSTGAFDYNPSEVDAWFLFIPGYDRVNHSSEFQGTEDSRDLSTVVISFLCDAVSTVGNSLYKYLDLLRVLVSKLNQHEDCPDFSPLVICILKKCIRVLESDSGNLKLSERSLISLYVRNTLSFILQNQVNVEVLPSLVILILKEKLNEPYLADCDSCRRSLCEWRPLNDLLLLAESILHQQACYPSLSVKGRTVKGNTGSLAAVLCKVSEFLEHGVRDGLGAVATAMCFSIICATSDDLLENFPLLLAIVQHVPRVHIQFLSFILLQREFLANIANRWPDLFLDSLENVGSLISNNFIDIVTCQNYRVSNAFGIVGLNHTPVIDSMPSLVVSFCLFLECAPFYGLFYGIMNSCNCKLFRSTKVLDILYAKLEEEPIGNCILSLRVVLFWAYLIRSCYREPSDYLEQKFEFCMNLVDHILDKILVQSTYMDTDVLDYALTVADLILHHPVVTLSISHPLCSNKTAEQEFVCDNLDAFLKSSMQYVHLMDYHILHLFTRLGEFMPVFGNGCNSASGLPVTLSESILNAFVHLIKQSISLFKEEFELFIKSKDLEPPLPIFYIFCSLMQFISPSVLMELVQWIFDSIDDNLGPGISRVSSILSVSFCITNIALEMTHKILHQTTMNATWLWDSSRTLCLSVLESVYSKILEFAIHFKSDLADLCLLKAVNVFSSQKSAHSLAALPSNMQLCRIIMCSPMKLITHCIHETNKVKARILFVLVEVSPLHLSLFGMELLGLIKGLSSADVSNVDSACPPKFEMIAGNCTTDFSDENIVLLLPAALSYLTSVSSRFKKQDLNFFGSIPSFYSRIILKGFSNWKSYSSGKLFNEDVDKSKPISVEQFVDYFSSTLLGKVIRMLHFYFILRSESMKRKHRLNIFNLIFDCVSPCDQLLDCDVREINPHLHEESFNLINRAIAKISFAKLLLFPPRNLMQYLLVDVDNGTKEPSKKTSSSENSAKLRFLNILCNSLDNLVKRFCWKPDQCADADCSYMFRFLEIHILTNIVQLSIDINSYLIQLPSVVFLNTFIRSSLLRRFEDPVTLRAMRIILSTVETKSSVDILALLLGHSEFVTTILSSDQNLDISSSVNIGTLSQPLPSLFTLLNFLPPVKEAMVSKVVEDVSLKTGDKEHDLRSRKLELIKLLRVLVHLNNRQQNVCSENGVNYRELLSLLLSGYGATLCEIDLECLHLMHEIELIEGSKHQGIAAMDYLWGSSAIKLRQEQSFDQLESSNKIADVETEDEWRRRFFRENIPLDSKRCMLTALHFCYDRAKLTEQMSVKNLVEDNVMNTPEALSSSVSKIQQYDPAFILPFSIHSLLRGYMEPVEFVRLGLLAVALVSISSSEEEIRKLGYDTLGSFKTILENYRNDKDALQLRLLLVYLQNGITEAWQKIPSVIAMFAAEASFILLDPSHKNFQVISKFLLSSPKVDLKGVPLFHMLFKNASIHFKANRLWILQLLYVGLNLDDDAQIFMRKLLFELLMIFYASSLADSGTRVLILQIVKKSVKLHMPANQLIKDHGLLPWLHLVISFHAERLQGDQKDFSLKQIESALEVINDVLSLRTITKWLEDDALEQLAELSQFLCTLFIGSIKFLKESVSLITSLLCVITSTLRISQKRKIFQPHFTLSIEALFQLCQAIDSGLMDSRFGLIIQLGLTTILLSTPPPVRSQMDKVKISSIALWAISAASQSGQTENNLVRKSYTNFINPLEHMQSEESLLSKILRWITASVILGSISDKASERNVLVSMEETKAETLQILLEKVSKKESENGDHDCHGNEKLAFIIFHLQYLLGIECAAFPSAISALCLLLSVASNQTGTISWNENQRKMVASLCRKISCPCEAHPSWRWSFYQPWRDTSLEQTAMQKIEVHHSCQILLLLLSDLFAVESDFRVQLYQDVECSGLLAWERSLLLGDR